MHVTSERIETSRLTLRENEPRDFDAIVALVTDPEVMRFVGDGVMTEERGRQICAKIPELYARGAWGIWTIEERATGEFLGTAEIKPRENEDWEIVYVLRRDAWGRGYATEVASALVRFGLERLGLPRVVATVIPENSASVHVLEKIGMTRIDVDEPDPYGASAVYATRPTPV
jgi:RimJ/RimL family protein N-acetyltransferase